MTKQLSMQRTRSKNKLKTKKIMGSIETNCAC
jgi:hypothetical protein